MEQTDTLSVPKDLSKIMDVDTLRYLDDQKGTPWGAQLYDIYFKHLMTDDLPELSKEKQEKYKKRNRGPRAYRRLMLFPWKHLDLESFGLDTITKLSDIVVQKPWNFEILDDSAINGFSIAQIHNIIRIKTKCPDCIEDFTYYMKNTESLGFNMIRQTKSLDVVYDFAEVHQKLKDEGKFEDPIEREKEEFRVIIKRNIHPMIDVYLHPEKKEEIFARCSETFTMIAFRTSLEKIKYRYQYFMIQVYYNHIENLIEEFGKFRKEHQETYGFAKYPEDQKSKDSNLDIPPEGYHTSKILPKDKKIQAVADANNWSVKKIKDAIKRVETLVKDHPVDMDGYYRTVFSYNSLYNDISIVSKADSDLHKKFLKVQEDSRKVLMGPKSKEYKEFANFLESKLKRTPTKTYTESTLYDLVQFIKNFNRSEYECMTSCIPTLTNMERNVLRQFYRDKILKSDCTHISSEEEILADEVLVIRGKTISPDTRKIVMKYMDEQGYPLYRGIFLSMIRAWADGKFEIEGYDFADLPDYEKPVEKDQFRYLHLHQPMLSRKQKKKTPEYLSLEDAMIKHIIENNSTEIVNFDVDDEID